MARRKNNLAKLDAQAAKLEAEKRWLALMAHWNRAAYETKDNELREMYLMRGAVAFACFDNACKETSGIIRTPTPKRSPFHCYDVYRCRSRLRGVQPTAKRAVEQARMYKKEVTVLGFTLDGDKHTVLIVNKHGEVTFAHPQFKVKLSESGGVV
jgi:hypothetical protein